MIFKTIREYLNNDFKKYISEWFPNVIRVNNSTWKTGDFNDTKIKRGNGSLVFNIREKYVKDFSTGETAGDIISIHANRFCNGSQKKYLKEFIERYNLQSMAKPHYLKKDKTETNLIFNENNNSNVIEHSNNNNIEYNNNEIIDYNTTAIDNNKGNNNNNTIEQTIEQEIIPLNITNESKTKNKKITKEDLEKDSKIKNILSKIEHYKQGDPVDLYLKSRSITKYSNDTYIVNTDKMVVLVNLCHKTITNTKKEFEETGRIYKRTDTIAGIQEIFLTREGKKRETSATPSKIQRSYSNNTISGNPVRLAEKGDNNGYIYITEGIENGLSIQEHINNEVWCALSIVNIPTLPFENNKVYVFVLDNDYKKETKVKANETLKEKLKLLDINYRIETENNDTYIVYNTGEFNLKTTLNKLKQLKNKHLFYLIPKEDGYEANDLLKKNKLKELLLDIPLKEIESEGILKLNKRTKEVVYWRPQKPYGTNDNDNLTKDFIGIPYNNRGLAIRFLKRFGDNYKKVDGIGICRYDDGKYNQKQEYSLFADIQQTLRPFA